MLLWLFAYFFASVLHALKSTAIKLQPSGMASKTFQYPLGPSLHR